MKFFANFVLIFLLLELQTDGGFGSDINFVHTDFLFGERKATDALLQERVARVPPGYKIWGLINAVVNDVVNITLSAHKAITLIELIQQKESKFKASRLGNLQILSGGIGDESVSLNLSSERGYGFNYKINVYGRTEL